MQTAELAPFDTKPMKDTETLDLNVSYPYDPDFDYSSVNSLRREAVQKLNLYKPVSIGQASRISGVSPADISVLLVYLGH